MNNKPDPVKTESSACGRTDRRQRKSREAILSAFSDLLAEKQYAGITVRDIIDRADVGRSTFYAHFETKDDLLRALCNELFDHVLYRDHKLNAPGSGSIYDSEHITLFSHILSHLRDRNGEMLKLLGLQQDSMFTLYFKERMRGIIRDRIVNHSIGLPDNTPADYVADHVACSFVDTVVWWAKTRPELPPDEIYGYFRSVLGPLLEKDF